MFLNVDLVPEWSLRLVAWGVKKGFQSRQLLIYDLFSIGWFMLNSVHSVLSALLVPCSSSECAPMQHE